MLIYAALVTPPISFRLGIFDPSQTSIGNLKRSAPLCTSVVFCMLTGKFNSSAAAGSAVKIKRAVMRSIGSIPSGFACDTQN